jgi:DNA-binding CsgD family transcriptional regulator
MNEINIHNEGLQKALGGAGALLQVGLVIADLAEPEGSNLVPVYAVLGLLFLASCRFIFLGPIQAGLYFALTGVQTADSFNSFYGLGFAAIAAFILFRRGWFVRDSGKKAAWVSAVGAALLLLPIALSGKPLLAQAPALISAGMYATIVYGLARGKVLSALGPKKAILRLKEYKLTKRETQLVKQRLLGKSAKVIAYECGLASSTVRTALSLAYRKLGLACGDELRALAERYRVE